VRRVSRWRRGRKFMSDFWWALPLIGLCDPEGGRPSLETRVIVMVEGRFSV
jgi:hypothetical protein